MLARMPPALRCPLSPSSPRLVASAMNLLSSSSVGARKQTFISDRLSGCAVPRKKSL